MITTNILTRVFFIKFNDSYGTGFTIEKGGKQFFVTANHIFDGTDTNKIIIEIFHEKEWKKIEIEKNIISNDIIIFSLPYNISPKFDIGLGFGNIAFGQDVYFLGFPYTYFQDHYGLNNGFPFPIIKKGILSGIIGKGKDKFFLFDGHNNPGFSGGPIVFENKIENKLCIGGVISSYRKDENNGNSGLFIGYQLEKEILELL